MFADLIDGPLAHIPSGHFGANSAWILCAAIAHNLLRAAGVLTGEQHSRSARIHAAAQDHHFPLGWPVPNADRSCTCPPTGPGQRPGLRCGTTPSATAHR